MLESTKRENSVRRNHAGVKSLNMLNLFLFLLILIASAFSKAQEELHDRWSTHTASEEFSVNHNPLSSIFQFIQTPGQRDTAYSFYLLKGRGLSYIQQYKTYLQEIPVSNLNRDEQLAYWLNLHNLLVIETISKNESKAKRLKRRRGIPGDPGVWWSQKVATVEGVALSLEDIEQNILAKHWKDQPNFLYGLFYGARGNGFKGTDAFTGARVHKQLESMAKKFVNNKDNVDVRKGELRLSSLYQWNKAQLFNNDDATLIAHLQNFADDKRSMQLANVSSISDKHKYNWKSMIYTPPRQNSNFGAGATGGGAAGGGYRGGS